MKLAKQHSLLLLSILLFQLGPLTAQLPEFVFNYCSTTGNYTSGSTYQNNLKALLSSLSSNTDVFGFYNSSSGEYPNRAIGLALCRGDATPKECRSCVWNATVKILENCPYQMEALGWYLDCMIGYSNGLSVTTFGTPGFIRWGDNVSNVNEFQQVLETLLNDLKGRAASGNSLRKYATGNSSVPGGFQTIYALSQCTPTLSQIDCINCLEELANWIPKCCVSKTLQVSRTAAFIGTNGCQLEYNKYLFFKDPAPLPSPPPPSQPPSLPSPLPGKKNKNNIQIVIIAIAASSCVAVIVLIISICFFKRARRPGKVLQTIDEIISAESLQFDFATIRAITENFSDAKKIGQGGFGAVYKGTLPNGQYVATKRLSTNSGQGDLEFKNEVLLVAKLQHRNLVKLLGFCLEGKERLLIYEFVPNASLDRILFDPNKRRFLSWESRYKIIGGIARGLLYLHEDSRLKIIHRDLKASNVLIDEDMTPKIADFGMARLFVVDQTQDSTNRIVGTHGYMAPEYARRGHFSAKSDVFSFGVLILEIISGKKNSDICNGEKTEDLLSYAWRNWREGIWSNVIDPSLTDGSRNEMMRCIHIGLLCVQENEAARPTMASVVLMLNSNSLTLPLPSQPGFFAGVQQL